MKGDLKMKVKSIFAVSLLAAGAAFADTTEVDTEYVLGVMPVSTGSKRQVILSIPWVQEGVGGNVAVSNVVKTAGLTAGADNDASGDTLTWYSTAEGKYETWRLVNRDGVYYWKESSTVTDTSKVATDPSVAKFKQGEAMVLTMTGTPASTLYVVGQVGTEGNPSTTIAASGYTLLAPPAGSTSDVNINTVATGWNATCVGGDRIIIDAVGGLQLKYMCKAVDDGNGGTVYKWAPTYDKTNYDAATIPAGRGFWYYRAANSDLTVTWQSVPHT